MERSPVIKFDENITVHHLVMSIQQRKGLPIQDLACCDYFRTSVDFGALEIFRIVGKIVAKSRAMIDPAIVC